MRCQRCGGFAYPEKVYAQGYWIKQIHCIPCGDIHCIREPMEAPIPERRTGRGKDGRKRQRYGTSKQILQLSPEEWDHCKNQDLSQRFQVSPTWISQLRRSIGRARCYKSRGLDRVQPSTSRP